MHQMSTCSKNYPVIIGMGFSCQYGDLAASMTVWLLLCNVHEGFSYQDCSLLIDVMPAKPCLIKCHVGDIVKEALLHEGLPTARICVIWASWLKTGCMS